MRFARLAAVLLASTAVVGSVGHAQTASQNAAQAREGVPNPDTQTPVANPAPQGRPVYGTYGFDTKGMDTAIKPGDDFYGYANGTWAKTTPIPADKSNYGSFNVLDDLSRERTRGILDAAAKEPGSKVGTAYTTYLDTAAIEAKGLAPIKPWIGRIMALKDKAGYAALAAEASRANIPTPFGAGVGQDDKKPEVYALGLRQAGLGMPDRDCVSGLGTPSLACAAF